MVFATLLISTTLLAVIWDGVYLRGVDSLDVVVYQCYARGFWQGAQAAQQAELQSCTGVWSAAPRRFRSFPDEYPAPALTIFSLPLLMPWLSYATGYVLWMALCLLVAAAILAWRGPPEAAVALPLYLLLAGWTFTLQRYDLIPGLCILLMLALARHGRFRAAVVALAAATVLKAFAIVLLPLLLIAARRSEHGRWRLDLIALFVGICALILLPVAVVAPSALWSPLHFELARPLHIESLPGSLVWLASTVLLGPASGSAGGPSIVFSYRSLNVLGGPQTALSVLALLAGAAGILIAYRRAWRGQDSPARSVVVVLIVLLATGKVFSPQYLLWVLPVVAVAEGIRVRWLLIAALTCFIMYCYYTVPLSNLPLTPRFIAAIITRDLLLCALAVLYLVAPGDRVSGRWPNTPAWHWLLASDARPR
jgi:hypothetical protein